MKLWAAIGFEKLRPGCWLNKEGGAARLERFFDPGFNERLLIGPDRFAAASGGAEF